MKVYRVEDSINRICRSFENIKAVNCFALNNVIIISYVYNSTNYTTMRRVNDVEPNLEKITLLNELSRKIVSGVCNIDEAFIELKNIKNKLPYKGITTAISLAATAPFLNVIFGGTLKDFFPAVLAVLFEMMFYLHLKKYKLPSFLLISFSAGAVTFFTIMLERIMPIENMSSIIIAGILPLFPGIKITNSMRDILSADILSGMIGIISAIFTAVSIAVGVVFMLKLFG